jgi:hypothetical protein
MIRTNKPLLFLLIISTIFTARIFSQEAGDAGVYVDQLFNKYIELENSFLQKEVITRAELGALRRLRREAEEAGRRDILSRLEMLEFIARTLNEQDLRSSGPDAILAEIAEAEQQRLEERRLLETGRTIKIATITAAAVSGSLFLSSSILYDIYHSKYINSVYADQAAFFLFWWQIFEQVSIYSGLTTIAASAAAGILNAVF